MAKKTREDLIHEQAIENYRKQLTEEKLLADMNRFTYEKMYYFIEGTKLIPEYERLVAEQSKKNQEYQQQIQQHQTQGEAIINEVLTPAAVAQAAPTSESDTPDQQAPTA